VAHPTGGSPGQPVVALAVVAAAWAGAGSPMPPASRTSGSCSRCGRTGLVCGSSTAISKQFTGFDDWCRPGGRSLCPVCAWAFSAGELRMRPHLVRQDPPQLDALDYRDVVAVLSAAALDPAVALVVPLRPGRKHLLPGAAWGRVSLDNAQIPWATQDAHRLTVLRRLRAAGFGTRMLREPAPAYEVMRTVDAGQWVAITAAWAELAPWRAADNPWMELCLRITTPTEKRAR
jgi:hypothetical protein